MTNLAIEINKTDNSKIEKKADLKIATSNNTSDFNNNISIFTFDNSLNTNNKALKEAEELFKNSRLQGVPPKYHKNYILAIYDFKANPTPQNIDKIINAQNCMIENYLHNNCKEVSPEILLKNIEKLKITTLDKILSTYHTNEEKQEFLEKHNKIQNDINQKLLGYIKKTCPDNGKETIHDWLKKNNNNKDILELLDKHLNKNISKYTKSQLRRIEEII